MIYKEWRMCTEPPLYTIRTVDKLYEVYLPDTNTIIAWVTPRGSINRSPATEEELRYIKHCLSFAYLIQLRGRITWRMGEEK